MEKVKAFYKKYLNNSFFFCLVWAFILNLIIETLARKGFGGFLFLFDSPLVFFYNTLIIFATLVIATLFRRRVFFVTVVTIVWMAIGITNGIILIERMTPFTVKDLSAITDGATIITNYFSMTEIVLIGAAILAGIIGLVILWIKAPKKEEHVNWKRNVAVVVLVIAFTFGATFGLIKVNVLSTFFGNLAYAYDYYGVPYCFINTWLNTGINKPKGYSEEEVKAIFSKDQYNEDGTMKLEQTDVDEEYPNILFLQLESFVDPELFNNIELSSDPIPTFRKMMKDYSSGSLTVPACGAGTANTEFEVMTGLSVKFFGPGEYPFKSVLKEKTGESIAFDLKSMGYSTHAIHNHRALFYNRNEVFNNIGYDTFTSLEYMSDVPKTPKNWAKDTILTKQILDAMNSTKERDYIYTISVQGHGKYPTEQLIKNPKITVTDAPSEELKWKYEYYVNQVYEMDQFVKELTDTLSKYDEDVILVMYGDHIPALDVTESSYDAKDLYQTQYVIWSNFDMEKKDMNLTTYQLAAEVFDRIGIHTGTTIKYHQSVDHKSKDYLSNLKMLGYDMLYGQDYIYGGSNPFEKSGMKMGVKSIKIDKVVNIGGKYYIKGQNFTEYSKVTLNGETLKTIYLGPSLLGLLEEVDPADAVNMKVSQIDKSNKEIISTTE
ncbi:Phosphoglycerol transferase and related proteins%2C alkaline phosphatase superfamily [uncultured Eubacterium sp.]|nr:Phosphoglycerol transferase and related proteins%2C alkaline phosphatase superfamily [uncultured Eubacterium sp.]